MEGLKLPDDLLLHSILSRYCNISTVLKFALTSRRHSSWAYKSIQILDFRSTSMLSSQELVYYLVKLTPKLRSVHTLHARLSSELCLPFLPSILPQIKHLKLETSDTDGSPPLTLLNFAKLETLHLPRSHPSLIQNLLQNRFNSLRDLEVFLPRPREQLERIAQNAPVLRSLSIRLQFPLDESGPIFTFDFMDQLHLIAARTNSKSIRIFVLWSIIIDELLGIESDLLLDNLAQVTTAITSRYPALLPKFQASNCHDVYCKFYQYLWSIPYETGALNPSRILYALESGTLEHMFDLCVPHCRTDIIALFNAWTFLESVDAKTQNAFVQKCLSTLPSAAEMIGIREEDIIFDEFLQFLSKYLSNSNEDISCIAAPHQVEHIRQVTDAFRRFFPEQIINKYDTIEKKLTIIR